MAEIPINTPEKKEVLDDNARKFITEGLTSDLLKENGATSFILTTDWLETGEGNEKKLAYKEFENGDIQILLIEKVTKDGNRTSVKEKITNEKYNELVGSSILRIQKKRYEFSYSQNDIQFDVKYDEFTDSPLRVVEVDALNEGERDSFDPARFPSELAEVTGDIRYYGYRVGAVL
jgi:hypothetical protein